MSNDGRSAQLGSRMCVDGGWRARWVTQMFQRCAGSNRRRAAGGAGVLNSESRRVDVLYCVRDRVLVARVNVVQSGVFTAPFGNAVLKDEGREGSVMRCWLFGADAAIAVPSATAPRPPSASLGCVLLA